MAMAVNRLRNTLLGVLIMIATLALGWVVLVVWPGAFPPHSLDEQGKAVKKQEQSAAEVSTAAAKRTQPTRADQAEAALVDKITKPVWGEAKNGIQLGISGISPNSTFRTGERLRFALHLKNSSDKEVHVVNHWPKPLGKVIAPVIENAAGERVEYPAQPNVRGGHYKLQYSLKPGQTTVIGLQGILTIGKEGEEFPGRLPHERCWCSLAPGKYRIVGSFLLTPIAPATGNRRGKPVNLTSRKVAITVEVRRQM